MVGRFGASSTTTRAPRGGQSAWIGMYGDALLIFSHGRKGNATIDEGRIGSEGADSRMGKQNITRLKVAEVLDWTDSSSTACPIREFVAVTFAVGEYLNHSKRHRSKNVDEDAADIVENCR
ncbi:hypothetical protein E1B28_012177 [Marasmius oreades]|uniref:Uncharacterized protein n=1 Tax=Marasmius oreades TaxID=181124 RepID=A0A9P7RR53_9AGAR|nr:uncharacterized protein E1B28_012177 [Marasmius oreades]KAG7088155.1 hypothetical protein E1B28_012177 [Marasmius oreades]